MPFQQSIWRRKWQPTPVFLPGKSCGQRSLVGWSMRLIVGHDLVIKQQQTTNDKLFQLIDGKVREIFTELKIYYCI